MESVTRGGFYTFNCGRWLSTSEDDGQTLRELPAEGSGVKAAPSITLPEVFSLLCDFGTDK